MSAGRADVRVGDEIPVDHLPSAVFWIVDVEALQAEEASRPYVLYDLPEGRASASRAPLGVVKAFSRSHNLPNGAVSGKPRMSIMTDIFDETRQDVLGGRKQVA